MKRFHQLLQWLRIEDRKGQLSLTTVAFVVACYCVLAGKGVSVEQLGALAVVVGAHRHRQAQEPATPAPVPAPEP